MAGRNSPPTIVNFKIARFDENSMVAAIADECVMRLARADCVAMKRSPKIGGAVPARGVGG